MLKSLEKILETQFIEINDTGEKIPLHSNTSKEQGLFLQQVFDIVKPKKTLEVGLAYGISALFFLEKHREYGSSPGAHLAIEPDNYWGTAAVYNIEKEGLLPYLQIRKDYSDRVLPSLSLEDYRIQLAYIDTTKQFDVVMQDVYFINKILDTGGVIILDDCGGNWPGVQRVARFINTLPHYKLLMGHSKIKITAKRKMAQSILSFIMNCIPFKKKFYVTLDVKNEEELGLDYRCLAFQKIEEDKRLWNYDKAF
jgi:predicted O-methyltransferase YrrM